MTPMRDPSEPSVLDRRQLSTPSLRYRFSATGDRHSILRAAAISGAIDRYTSHGRHQHPDRGALVP
jgi:hypothetical protein